MKTLDALTKEDKIACIKNWVEELNQELETRGKLLEEYRKGYSSLQSDFEELRKMFNSSQIDNDRLISENSKLKNSNQSPSQEEINKLVNDKIAMIFSNPLTYLMSLSESERNEFIGRIYTLITGIKFI
jgi:chromosome segregation ATPase